MLCVCVNVVCVFVGCTHVHLAVVHNMHVYMYVHVYKCVVYVIYIFMSGVCELLYALCKCVYLYVFVYACCERLFVEAYI